MNIWGKVIGGAAGFAIGGPIGALLGTVAGHAVDTKILPQYITNDDSYKSIIFNCSLCLPSPVAFGVCIKLCRESFLCY